MPLKNLANARAMKQGNALTLAIVVPINARKVVAQETLRGAAQAQDDFNNQRQQSNKRLLKIIIANDDSDPKQAPRVARKLN